MSVEEICRRHNISTQSYYRWRSKYGGMDLKEAQRLRDLEKEPSSSEIDNHKVVARRGDLQAPSKQRAQEAVGRPDAQGAGLVDRTSKKHLSPERQRTCAHRMRVALSCSGRQVSRWLCFHRSTLRYRTRPVPKRRELIEAEIISQSRKHSTLGYKKVTVLLRAQGYAISKKWVQRVRREEGL